MDSDDFVVIDKPGGVPSHAIMENLHENVIECMKQCLQAKGQSDQTQLFLPQRLDVETSGLMVLIKNKKMIAS